MLVYFTGSMRLKHAATVDADFFFYLLLVQEQGTKDGSALTYF